MNVKAEVERAACAMGAPIGSQVSVFGRTFDGKRCGGEIALRHLQDQSRHVQLNSLAIPKVHP